MFYRNIFRAFFSLIVLIPTFLLGGFLFLRDGKIEDTKSERISAGYHYSFSSIKETYGVLDKPIFGGESDKNIFGGIVSHHLYVADEISGFFAQFREQKPDTIVIVGPNHYDIGNEDILISEYDYKTPFGIVSSDNVSIDKLLAKKIVNIDEKVFETEHSISVPISYISHYLPNTKVIPIVLKKNTTRWELDNLSNSLKEILSPNSIVIASVDFSHHLNKEGSKFHDAKSISVIENFDYDNIFNLEIDSPPSIYVLLKFLETKGARKMRYVNTNSIDASGNNHLTDVTSYLFAYFTGGRDVKDENVSILSFGDAMFDRGVKLIMDKGKDPFEFIKGEEGNFVKGYDFGTLNLEGPITESGNGQSKEFNFKFEPKVAGLLKDNNFNMVNLANNHISDYFSLGLKDTRENLDEYGIGYLGGFKIEDSYKIKNVGDKKIAFVGIDESTTPIRVSDFYPLIKKLKAENDFVVVNIHWGYEYDKIPSEIQKDIGHNLIDSGADVVLGHHPHVIQPVEVYKNGVIFYSLGNFIFDQINSYSREGIGVGTILEKTKKTFYIFPFEIVGNQPKLLDYSKSLEFCTNYLSDITNKDICKFEISN